MHKIQSWKSKNTQEERLLSNSPDVEIVAVKAVDVELISLGWTVGLLSVKIAKKSCTLYRNQVVN